MSIERVAPPFDLVHCHSLPAGSVDSTAILSASWLQGMAPIDRTPQANEPAGRIDFEVKTGSTRHIVLDTIIKDGSYGFGVGRSIGARSA